jgi:hypothetical protein
MPLDAADGRISDKEIIIVRLVGWNSKTSIFVSANSDERHSASSPFAMTFVSLVEILSNARASRSAEAISTRMSLLDIENKSPSLPIASRD